MIRQKLQFTKDGYEKLISDLKTDTEKRKEAVVRLRTAREMGDLSENGAYKAARFELSTIDRNIRRLTYLIRIGKIIERADTDTADIGKKIILYDGEHDFEFMLVNTFESDPKNQKLSTNSPVGHAVYGKKAGENITVNSPGGVKNYKIMSIK